MKNFILFLFISLSLNASKSDAQTWNLVGSEWFSSGPDYNNGIVIDTSGTPYVVFEDGGDSHKATVMKYNGSSWVYVGSEGFSAGGVESPSIAIDRSGTLYVAYADSINGYKATVMKYNGSSWVDVGIAGFSGGSLSNNSISIAIDTGGTPYVVFGDIIVSDKATVMKFNGSSWVIVGSEGFTSAGINIFSMAIDSSGTPYVAYMDATVTNAVSVMKYNGSSWVTVGTAGFSSGMEDYISIAIGTGGIPYVAYSRGGPGGKASVMQYNGSSWVNVGTGAISAGEAQFTTIAINVSGTPYVVYSDSAYSWKATLKKYTDSSWVTVGGGGFTAGPAGYTSLAIDRSGTPYVVYEDAYATINRATVQKFVSTPILGTDSVCQGYTTHLSNITSGGTWSSSNTSVATVGTGSGIVTGVSAGTAKISYTISGSSDTVTITINPLPNAGTIIGLSMVCVSSSISLTDTATGGIWSSSNTSIASVGSSTGIVTGAIAGVDTIKYTVTNSCSIAVATKIVTVNHLPNAGAIIGLSMVCIGSPSTLTDATTGGTWSSGSTSIATVGSTGIVNAVSAGTVGISYSVINSCGTASVTQIVTVNILPVAGAIVPVAGSVCVGSILSLTDVTSSGGTGTWSSGNLVAGTIDSILGNVGGISAGTTMITYTLTSASCGIATATAIVTVNPLPNAGSIGGASFVCIGLPTILTDATPGGTWSSSNTLVATTATTGVVTGVAAGTATISYSVTNSCGTAVTSKLVTVNITTAGTITGLSSACGSAIFLLSDATIGGVWSSGSSTIASVGSSGYVTTISAGTATISYTVSNSCGTYYATHSITVNSLPLTGTITGPSSVCSGSTVNLTDATTGGTWNSGSTGIATVGSTGIVSGLSTGTAIVSYSVTNSCGTAYATEIVTVNPVPNIGSISGVAHMCTTGTATLTDTIPGGTWSSSNTSIASVGSSTGTVTGVSVGTATITYSITNTCGITATSTTIATINPLPNAGTITGLNIVCVSNSITLTDTVTGGLWSASNGRAFVSSVGVVLGVSGGLDTIKYSVTNSCGTNSVTEVVTVNPEPSAGIITGLDSVCVSSSIILTDTVTGGTWGASNGNAFVSSAGVVLGVTAGLDDITYAFTNVCGTGTTAKNILVVDCLTGIKNISAQTDEITIYPNPTQNNITVTSSEQIHSIVVYNLIGQKVYSDSYDTNNAVVSLEQLPYGVYVIKINGDKVYKIIKQ